MAGNCGREISHDVELLQLTGFSHSEQASRGQLACGTAIPETDFSLLHTCAQGSFALLLVGSTPWEVAEALDALADFYSRQDKYNEAESLYRRVLAIQEKQQPPDLLSTIGVLEET